MTFSDAQIIGWLESWFWPLVRIGGVLAIAPVLGARVVPVRIRVVLTVLLTLVMAPTMPTPPYLAPFEAGWWLEIGKQMVIGVAMGFVLMLVFEAVVMAGELIAYGMGLSFAQLVDPLRGAGTPVVGQLLMVLGTLLFLSTGGHLRLIEALHASFVSMPVGGPGLNADNFLALARWGGSLFAGGVQIGLPVVIALLLVNLAFGVMSRSAPALSALSVGFPIALAAGLVLLRFSLPGLAAVMARMLDDSYALLATLFGG
ncbi:flagellar biosynthetic protein FliR [Nevskia ramosa]|uniref:flagellar biosynthetic protein FliR n=1 Tax=Nevskia ramosa TaxID=64002 RepID=UPI0003B41E80|nr:flagellar biosynthetic protein FliR [Nevskia ramosa]